MSGRRSRSGADDRHPFPDGENKTGMEDIELIVEGKKVKTNSGLLSQNSNVLATLISNAYTAKRVNDDDVLDLMFQSERSTQQKLRLEMPNLKYKDVKVMVDCLMSSSTMREELTETKALRILPLVDNFRIKRLKKACGNTLYDSITAKKKDLEPGCIPSRDLLPYLAAADQYNFDKLRRVCIDELARNVEPSDRVAIQSDKHVSDKSKVKIFGKMFDEMDKEYERRVRQVRQDMDENCLLLEQKRDELMEQLEIWKDHLRQEIDELIKANKNDHQELIDDLYQKGLVDEIFEMLKKTRNDLFKEMEKIHGEVNYVFKMMEEIETAGEEKVEEEEEITGLKENLKDAIDKNQENITTITCTFKELMERNMNVCFSSVASLNRFTASRNLEEKVSSKVEELENKIKSLARYQIQYEEEVIAHKKTQAELLKMKQNEHKINTWLKWAKPAIEDEDKCQCYRHCVTRK